MPISCFTKGSIVNILNLVFFFFWVNFWVNFWRLFPTLCCQIFVHTLSVFFLPRTLPKKNPANKKMEGGRLSSFQWWNAPWTRNCFLPPLSETALLNRIDILHWTSISLSGEVFFASQSRNSSFHTTSYLESKHDTFLPPLRCFRSLFQSCQSKQKNLFKNQDVSHLPELSFTYIDRFWTKIMTTTWLRDMKDTSK